MVSLKKFKSVLQKLVEIQLLLMFFRHKVLLGKLKSSHTTNESSVFSLVKSLSLKQQVTKDVKSFGLLKTMF